MTATTTAAQPDKFVVRAGEFRGRIATLVGYLSGGSFGQPRVKIRLSDGTEIVTYRTQLRRV